MRYTNYEAIPLPLAVWLVHDDYDHVDDPNYISATSLLKSTRQIILSSRVPEDQKTVDISSLYASSMGSALHDAIERAWKSDKLPETLVKLGLPPGLAKKVVVNPDPASLTGDEIPVYLEQRTTRQLGKWIIGGKFDFIGEGQVKDFKSTSTYGYIKGNRDEDYIMQGSIYRWLNPHLISEETLEINYIFTDWSAGNAQSKSGEGYPPKRMMPKTFALKSPQETEAWLRNKIHALEIHEHTPEPQLPLCGPKELWQDKSTWKYYKKPEDYAAGKRSTKNFDSPEEAHLRCAEDGGKGLVVEVKGMVKGCLYCDGFSLCSQKDQLIADGLLKI